jgi:hypothetical protein
MAFDPNAHLRNLKGQSYLDVKWRLLWLREEHPDAIITTSLEQYRDDTQMWVFKAQVVIPGGGSATGHGQETERDFPAGALEKSETKAIGRALAALGYGTQFALERDASESEGDRPADSPVQPTKAAPRPNQPGSASSGPGSPAGESPTSATSTAPASGPTGGASAPPASSAADTPSQVASDERQQARQLATRINGLCDALSRARPQGTQGLAQLGTALGLHAPPDGRFSVEWREQVIVRLENKLAAQRAAELAPPIVTGPPSADTETTPVPSGEPWGEPDVLNALAAANAEDMEGIALAIINAHAAGTLTNDTASALAACVDLAERAFKATSAGQIAQVEIDAKASTALNADQFNAVSSLTRRVRAMSGWAGSNGTNSRPPAVAATAGAGGR